MDDNSKISILFLGWLFGILGHIILSYNKSLKDKKSLLSLLRSEFDELSIRLALLVFHIKRHFGDYDKDFLEWFLPIIKRYEGPNKTERIAHFIETLLNAQGNQLEFIKAMEKAPEDKGISLKKYYSILITSYLPDISHFDRKIQRQLFDIKSRLNFLNEEIDEARYYHKLTFGDLSKENYKMADQNANNSYQTICSMAKSLVDKINDFKL